MVTSPNEVLETDIDTIIADINTEENLRSAGGTPYTDIAGVAAGGEIFLAKFIEMLDRNIEINAEHCYCQGQGSIETHNGGSGISLTASASDFGSCSCNTLCGCNTEGCSCEGVCTVDPGCGCDVQCPCNAHCDCETQCNCEVQGNIEAADINKIIADRLALYNQCNCDTYSCICETNDNWTGSPTCGNNNHAQWCSQFTDCCANNKVCSNNVVCINQSVCTNNTVCTCDNDCTCDDVCSCEYGG